MSTMPWGTMNDWMRLEVEQRTTTIERRMAAAAARAARRSQAAPVVRPALTRPAAPIAVSRAACAEAA